MLNSVFWKNLAMVQIMFSSKANKKQLIWT